MVVKVDRTAWFLGAAVLEIAVEAIGEAVALSRW
jgi:hypothetical protein